MRFPEHLLIGQPHCSLLALLGAVPAGAASVAYIDDHNLWLSSPDGSQKFQMTQGGSEDASWNFPSQGPDGTTVVSHRDTFEGGAKRPVLYRYGADGKLDIADVMPVYSGATAPVYPITLDMDWKSNAVAYGYSYCGFACQSVYRGYKRAGQTVKLRLRPTRAAKRAAWRLRKVTLTIKVGQAGGASGRAKVKLR